MKDSKTFYLEILQLLFSKEFNAVVEEIEDEATEDNLKEQHDVTEAADVTRKTEHLIGQKHVNSTVTDQERVLVPKVKIVKNFVTISESIHIHNAQTTGTHFSQWQSQ